MAVRDLNPALTDAATLILSRYYQSLRSFDPSSCTRTTPRLLGSLARLCRAHAKLTGRSEAHIEDACVAVLLMERSLGVRPLLNEFIEELEGGLFGEAFSGEFYERFEGALLRKLEIRIEAFESVDEEAESVEDDAEQLSQYSLEAFELESQQLTHQ